MDGNDFDAGVKVMDGQLPEGGGGRKKRTSPIWQFLSVWKTWVIIFTPLILMPLPILHPSKAGKCAYGVIIMAIYWMTEAMPMAVTALLPVVIMPWLGVVSAKQLATNYLKDTNMLFFGGLIVAVAVEKWNLHKRIALRVLLLVGSEPRWLMFGFMTTTAFLSMWISNTATTAMMVPIAQAVLTELGKHKDKFTGQDNPEEVKLTVDKTESPDIPMEELPHSEVNGTNNEPKEESKSDKAFSEMCKGLTLSVAYAANIGGTATLTGTGPNLVMKGQVDTLYGGGTGINFSSWFIFALPNMMICLFLAWWWLQILFLGLGPTFSCCRKKKHLEDDTVKQVIRDEYTNLGPFSFAEVAVLMHFILLALLWLTREPEFVPGWAALFPEGHREYITDACVAITISISLFVFPSRMPNVFCFRKKSESSEPGPVPPLLDWETVNRKMAWGVVLVLGGGFALADSCQKSGLSDAIGGALVVFSSIPTWILVAVLCAITAVFTEVTSNVATATIFLPILAELAESTGVNPLYFLVPVTVSTSFAFMLPVATPPNAIVFAYGNMRIIDMVKAGILMNCMCLVVLTFSINTYGYAYFHLGTFPAWANDTVSIATAKPDINSTLLQNCTQLLLQMNN